MVFDSLPKFIQKRPDDHIRPTSAVIPLVNDMTLEPNNSQLQYMGSGDWLALTVRCEITHQTIRSRRLNPKNQWQSNDKRALIEYRELESPFRSCRCSGAFKRGSLHSVHQITGRGAAATN